MRTSHVGRFQEQLAMELKDVEASQARFTEAIPRTMHQHTLPKTNIATENRPLEKEIPIGNHHFQVLC